MTTVEAIQNSIHYFKMELYRARKVEITDPIEKIQNEGMQNYFIEQLSDLRDELKYAIKLQQ